MESVCGSFFCDFGAFIPDVGSYFISCDLFKNKKQLLQEDKIRDKDFPLNPDACSLESDKRISSELNSVSFLSLISISLLISF
jgi:hypothetical protein